MNKLKFDSDFQNRLLGLIVYSPNFLKAARTLILPDHFKSDEQWTICTLAYAFFDKYGTAPKQNLLNELEKYAENSATSTESLELITTLFGSLYPDFSAEKYYYEEIIQFSKHEDLRSSLERFLPRFKTGNYNIDELVQELDEIDKIHRIALDGNSNGYNVLTSLSTRIARRASQGEISHITTLISPLDELFAGIEARQLGTIMAPSGVGKSWMLIHLAKAAVLQGKHVFHFTLEMGEEDISDRFDQMTVGSSFENLMRSRNVEILRTDVRRMINRGGSFVTKFLNPGTTVAKLEQYIQIMMAHYKVLPDLIVVDYGELLSPETNVRDLYLQQKDIWQGLKDLTVKMDFAIWTATQSSRGGVGARHLSEREIGDSYWKYRISDIFAGMNRYLVYNEEKKKWEVFEDEDEDSKIIRFFMMKQRKGKDKYLVVFVSDLERGMFYSKKATEEYQARKDDLGGSLDHFSKAMKVL